MAKIWIEEETVKGAVETIERLKEKNEELQLMMEDGETSPEVESLKSLVEELAEDEESEEEEKATPDYSNGTELHRTDK